MRRASEFRAMVNGSEVQKRSEAVAAAEMQLKRLEPAIEAAAQRSQTSVDWNEHLNEVALAKLKELGFHVRDDGDHVANAWHIGWER